MVITRKQEKKEKKIAKLSKLIMQLSVYPFTASVGLRLNYMCIHSRWDSQLSWIRMQGPAEDVCQTKQSTMEEGKKKASWNMNWLDLNRKV